MELNLGIIGYGGMADWHHRNCARIDGMKVLAAYDILDERVKLFEKNAEGLGEKEAKGYFNLDEMLKDPRINLVLVATPNDVHKELAVKAMSAGKNVICEKPVAMSVAELDEMIAASEKYKVLFTVHQNRRWDKDLRIVMDTVSKGYLGNVFSIESKLHGSNGLIHGWRAEKKHGGGMILDWGVHLIDQILFLLPNKLKTVYCQTYSIKNPEVDDFVKLILNFEGNIIAQIEIGTYCLRGKTRSWHVCGDAGGMTIEGWDCVGGITKVKKLKDYFEEKIAETSAGPTRTFAPQAEETIEEIPLPVINPQWTELYENIRDTLAGKTELIVKPAQVRRVFKVMEAAFKSSETGNTVWFDENL